MDGADRRSRILEILLDAFVPITGSELAGRFNVSRQIIVQDIALIRASGQDIVATPQGYILAQALTGGKLIKIIPCQHGWVELEKELNIIVDNGGKVLDVSVEHPLYGELKGMLMLASRRDVRRFVDNLQNSSAKPLSALTSGIHLHRVEAPSEEIFANIERDLALAGILLEK
ncbi:MAG: transcription repressor NadR [Desulfitobacteriaceae bacterium]|nr:transcription repressor NadR [Desulfitobacteriaceae bacterium]MDD4752420.1 transcription repressor NadR [Desulfitobacteriaceae bacterium]